MENRSRLESKDIGGKRNWRTRVELVSGKTLALQWNEAPTVARTSRSDILSLKSRMSSTQALDFLRLAIISSEATVITKTWTGGVGSGAGEELTSSRGLQLMLTPDVVLIFVVTSAWRPPGLPFVPHSIPTLPARLFQAIAVRVQIPRFWDIDQLLMLTLQVSDARERASLIG